MTLPRFLGLGALKAGTSTLHALLATHPGLALPEDRKELQFFDRHWDRGVAWYEACFAHAGARIPGEISPGYLAHPEAPARVAEVLPGARLLVLVRDPVARTISQWRFFRQENAADVDLATFLAEHPNAIARSRYAEQLARWLDHHPREALWVGASEGLAADPARVVRDVLVHVGADASFVPPNLGVRTNESGTPRFPRVRAGARRAIRWLYDHDLGAVVQAVKRTPLARFVDARDRGAGPPVPDDVRRRLADAVADDVARLRVLLPGLEAPWLR